MPSFSIIIVTTVTVQQSYILFICDWFHLLINYYKCGTPNKGLISILPSRNNAWSLSILNIGNFIAFSSFADMAYFYFYLSCHLNVYIPIFSLISIFCQPWNMCPHFKAILNGRCWAKPLIWTSMVLPWLDLFRSLSSPGVKWTSAVVSEITC